MVLRLTKAHNFILISPSRQQVAQQKAPECIPLVMEPNSKFYTSPVVVLVRIYVVFNSLGFSVSLSFHCDCLQYVVMSIW